MLTKTKIVLAAALLLSAGSAVMAGNDIETNPSTAQSAREWQEYLGQNPGQGVGSVASPSHKQDLSRRKAFGQ
jgi:hypothetical protein